jgi:hypothetical protein
VRVYWMAPARLRYFSERKMKGGSNARVGDSGYGPRRSTAPRGALPGAATGAARSQRHKAMHV